MCVVNNNVADCGAGTCAGGASMCIGTKIQACQQGIFKVADCNDYGDTCVVSGLGAHCRGTGATCQAGIPTNVIDFLIGLPIRCDGNVLVRCADSQESRFDCSSKNQKCFPN